MFGAVGIFAGDPVFAELCADGEVLLDPRVVLDFAGVDFGGIAGFTGFEEVIALGDDAGADDAVTQRDVPEPAAFRQIGDGGCSFFKAGVAFRVLIEGPDGNLVEHRVAVAGAVFPLVERVAAGAVEGDGCGGFEGILIAGAGADAGDAVTGFEKIEGGGVLTDFDAFGAGVVEEHEIEVLALDLPGGRGGMIEVLEKVEWGGDFPVGGSELDAVFAGETDLLHAVEDAEAIQREPAERHEGLADVVAGKGRLLDE